MVGANSVKPSLYSKKWNYVNQYILRFGQVFFIDENRFVNRSRIRHTRQKFYKWIELYLLFKQINIFWLLKLKKKKRIIFNLFISVYFTCNNHFALQMYRYWFGSFCYCVSELGTVDANVWCTCNANHSRFRKYRRCEQATGANRLQYGRSVNRRLFISNRIDQMRGYAWNGR